MLEWSIAVELGLRFLKRVLCRDTLSTFHLVWLLFAPAAVVFYVPVNAEQQEALVVCKCCLSNHTDYTDRFSHSAL